MCADGSVDTLDPQRAEVTLTVVTVAGCVLVGLIDGLTCNLEGVLAAAIIAFCCFDYLFVTGVGYNTTFNSRHSVSSLARVRHVAFDNLLVRCRESCRATSGTDEFGGAFDHAVAFASLTCNNAARGRHFKALFGA